MQNNATNFLHGTTINGSVLKKHRHDVFRLSLIFKPEDRFELPDLLKGDMEEFLTEFNPESEEWSAIQNAVGKHLLPDTAATITLIKDVYQLSR